ncbi:MAG: ATP-binding protein [Elusimicrobiota bacterium]
MKNRVILITGDPAIIDLFKKSCQRRKIEVDVQKNAKSSKARWIEEDSNLIGVVGDLIMMNQQEKIEVLQDHCQPGCPPLILLDIPGTPDPRAPTEYVTRLRWPLPASFMEALKELQDVPLVFFADPTLFLTGMLQARLRSVGIESAVVDSAVGVGSLLRQSLPRGAPAAGDASLWSKLSKKKDENAPVEPKFPSTVIAQFSGDVFDAAPMEARVRQEIPNARTFIVSSASAAHNAERALRRTRPAFLSRDLVEHSVDILLGKQTSDPMGLGRVLLVDNYKPSLIQLTTGLIQEGYEVGACMDAEQAMRLIAQDSYHLAVVGAALVYAQHTGIELAQKMREIDPDLRIILMVDQYPLQTALKGVTQVVEVGLDDCLLKPVEPSRLRFSISRALERRRLLLENSRITEELKFANEELEQLTDFQKKFFATVAHDVKNPLTAIRGYAEMLSWKVKDATLVKCVTHIQSSTRTLEGLISDLVDYAAIESGKLRVNISDMDLSQVVNEVKSRIEVAAEKREIQLHVSLPDKIPLLKGDPLRVGQVIQNLSTNAIQYTSEKGAVYVKVQVGANAVTISVRDTGIGISKEDLPRVFERFFQAENAQRMRKAGFGLGLKISQEIVKAHGGGMGVDSELGKGSVFYFTIPIPDPSQMDAAPPAAAQAAPKPSAAPGYPSMTGPHTPMPRQVQTPIPGQAPRTPVPQPPRTPVPPQPHTPMPQQPRTPVPPPDAAAEPFPEQDPFAPPDPHPNQMDPSKTVPLKPLEPPKQ